MEEDVTLRAARSPYLMTGDVVIPYGVTLTVEPGVVINVAGPQGLRVTGDLAARGTAERPIVFQPAAGSQPDEWRGIRFGALPGQRSGARSVLQYCRIRGAAAVELPRFGGEVSHCVFDGCLAGLVLKEGGTGRFHHNRFSRCARAVVVERGGGEVRDSEWLGCAVALAVTEVDPAAPLVFRGNSISAAGGAPVAYLKRPSTADSPLELAGNYWAGTPPGPLVRGAAPESVRTEPRLEAAPAGVGPGWR